MKVTNRRVSSQEFSVEGGVFLLSIREFLGEESQRRPVVVEGQLLCVSLRHPQQERLARCTGDALTLEQIRGVFLLWRRWSS